MIFDSIYIILEYDIILLNMKYSIKYTISFRLVNYYRVIIYTIKFLILYYRDLIYKYINIFKKILE